MTMDIGIGQIYNRERGMGGVTANVDFHYRRHALGIHVRHHQRGLIYSNIRLSEAAVVYSYRLVGGLSLGSGLSLVSEVHSYSDDSVSDDSVRRLASTTRWALPVEATLRITPSQSFGTFIRAHATFHQEQTFGGAGLGVTF